MCRAAGAAGRRRGGCKGRAVGCLPAHTHRAACLDEEAFNFWPCWSKARPCTLCPLPTVPFPVSPSPAGSSGAVSRLATIIPIHPRVTCNRPQLGPGLPQVGPAAAQLGPEIIAC